MELSFVLAGKGGNICNMNCRYCSADIQLDKNAKITDIEIDYKAMEEKIRSNPIYQAYLVDKNNPNKKAPEQKLTVNFWGGDPLMHTKIWDEMMEWLDTIILDYSIFISTNGLLFGAKHVQDWCDAHWGNKDQRKNIMFQISHDGLGQYIRSKDFDPFYDPKTKDFIVKMARRGQFKYINCTMNAYNCSPQGNKMYFDKWIFDNGITPGSMYIKLNHNNDADYTEPFRLKGESLRRYMHEMFLLWIDAYFEPDRPDMLPYRDYLMNQAKRNETFKGLGGCGLFSSGARDYSWAMNTKGEYVYCQLCNDNDSCPNPKCEMSEECSHCEFRNMDDCHPCPAMSQPKDCEYKKEYIRAVLRFNTFIQKHERYIRNLQANQSKKSCSCRPQ